MGDPDRADRLLIIDYPYHAGPRRWPHKRSVYDLKGGYMLGDGARIHARRAVERMLADENEGRGQARS